MNHRIKRTQTRSCLNIVSSSLIGPNCWCIYLQYLVKWPCFWQVRQNYFNFEQKILILGSDPTHNLFMTSSRLSCWDVFLDNFNLTSLKILLLASKPDSSQFFSPQPSFISINSHECPNNLCIEGVMPIHDLVESTSNQSIII